MWTDEQFPARLVAAFGLAVMAERHAGVLVGEVSLALFVSASSIYAYPSPIALSATYSYHYLSLSLLLPPQHLLYRSSSIGGSLYFVCASFPLAIAYASRQASKQ